MDKAETWGVLSGIIGMETKDDDGDGMNSNGDEDTVGTIVENILQYYESLGDVQMVSTVLEGAGRSVLPPNKQHKYDLCLQRYADILLCWRLFAKHAEVKKRYSHLTPSSLVEQDFAITSAIRTCFWCDDCNEEVINSPRCPKCNTYLFRCAISDVPVRGVFTFCHICGHGGHLHHMTKWFENHKVCPTGCGCECVPQVFRPPTDDGCNGDEPVFTGGLLDGPSEAGVSVLDREEH